ncbi:DNA-binding protein, partial [Burkholderia pseudomallei]
QQDARHDEAAAPNAVTTHDGAPRAAKKNTR